MGIAAPQKLKTLSSTTLLSFATHRFSSSLKISEFFCDEFPLVCVF
jgi:hypothetical protein